MIAVSYFSRTEKFTKKIVEAGTESHKRDKAKASSARQNDTREEQSKLKC